MAIHIDNVVEETNRRTGRDSEMDNKVQAPNRSAHDPPNLLQHGLVIKLARTAGGDPQPCSPGRIVSLAILFTVF